MLKKRNLKKRVGHIKKERVILWAVILVLIILQVVTIWYVARLWNDHLVSSKQALYSLIAKSEERRYKYPVISITENRVYIPELRIYLPLDDATRNLRYEYVNLPTYTSLRLGVSSTVGQQSETDDPFCDQVVVLSATKDGMDPAHNYVGELPSTIGSLRYMYVHNKATCSIYNDNIQDDLVRAAKLITKY